MRANTRLPPLFAMLLSACGGGTNAPNPPASAPAAPSSAPLPGPAPDAKGAAPAPAPKAEMSKQLGGMRLGMTIEQFVSTCQTANGEFARVGKIDVGCSLVPAPLHSAEHPQVDFPGFIFGKFCGAPDGTACELTYSVNGDVDHRDEQVRALVEMLADKYGPPTYAEGYGGLDPMRACIRERTLHLKRGWVFAPHQHPPRTPGWLRIVFECDLRGPKSDHSLMVFYDDADGLALRRDESRERRENF